jgi:DNA-binding CsgD family transcriptional regulator
MMMRTVHFDTFCGIIPFLRELMSDENFSRLVGRIYDAALDSSSWSDALQGMCEFLPGAMGNIFSQDTASASGIFMWGDDPAYTQKYLTTYAALNPLFPTGMFFPLGEIYSIVDIMPLEALRESRFSREWLEPQGYVDFISTNLQRSPTGQVAFSVVRHARDGLADEAAKSRMSLLVPHVQRAITIGRTIELGKVEAATLATAVDGLTAAMFLVTADARLAHANRAGLEMLDEGSVARIAFGKINFTNAATDVALRKLFAGAAQGDDAVGTGGIALPLGQVSGDEMVAHILPLTAGAREQTGRTFSAVAAVFVQKATIDFQSPLALVAERYQLSSGETRTLAALVAGQSVKEASEHLGLAEATLRSHLHRLFEKTGTSRQPDLIRLVAGYAGPVMP